jgi:hypothetical protein
MFKTHKFHPGAGENSHLSLLNEILTNRSKRFGQYEIQYRFQPYLLTMYLLNEKILRDGPEIRKRPKGNVMNISNYIRYVSFNRLDPPLGKTFLSYSMHNT